MTWSSTFCLLEIVFLWMELERLLFEMILDCWLGLRYSFLLLSFASDLGLVPLMYASFCRGYSFPVITIRLWKMLAFIVKSFMLPVMSFRNRPIAACIPRIKVEVSDEKLRCLRLVAICTTGYEWSLHWHHQLHHTWTFEFGEVEVMHSAQELWARVARWVILKRKNLFKYQVISCETRNKNYV